MEEVCCELQYSGAADALLCAAAGATLAIALLAPFPWWASAAICAWIGALTGHVRRKLAEVRGLRLRRSGEIVVEFAGGGARSGIVREGSFVAPWLTIVRWRPEGARFDRTLILVPGMAGAEPLRRIRVMLRWA